MKKWIVITGLSMLLAAPAAAQTPAPTYVVAPNSTFQVAWDAQDAVDGETVWFRMWLNGEIAKNFTGTDYVKVATATPGFYTFTVTVAGLAPGTYVLEISGYTSIGEAKSAPVNFSAGNKPGAPKNVRIIIVVG